MPGAWGRGNEDLAKGEGGGRSEAAEKEERRGGRGGGGGGDMGQGYGVQTSLRYVSMYQIMMLTHGRSQGFDKCLKSRPILWGYC